jgi:hypothetical protein
MLQQLFGAYGNLLVPAAVALLGVIVLIKIVIALEHAVLRIATALLTILVLGTVLLVGSSMIGRIHGIQSAAAAAARSVNAPSANGVIQASVLQRELESNARQALTGVGLNPAYLHLRISCGATEATLHLRYSDTSFLFGLLSHQEFTAALPNSVRCR